MGQRLRGRFKKAARDTATAQKKGETPKRHKVAVERSKKALKRKAFYAA